jgi:uncharacterized membrane protein YgaE (UPF0421/DUF939 family)
MSSTRENLILALKMGIAGVASIYIATLLKLPQGYWAAFSAFVVLGSDMRTTLKAAADRLLGTAIGAFLGGVFAYFWGDHLLLFGLAIALTVLICEVLRLGPSYRLACVTVALVMLINKSGSPWTMALYRFLEVALGIVVGVIISAVPPRRPTAVPDSGKQ